MEKCTKTSQVFLLRYGDTKNTIRPCCGRSDSIFVLYLILKKEHNRTTNVKQKLQ
jgi:hypothetical protein